MHFIILLLLNITLFGSTYNFDEYRFVYALEKEFVKSGTISIQKDKIIITYKKPDFRKITSDGDNISVESSDGEIEILEGDMLLYTKLYLDLIKKINTVDTLVSNRYFDVDKDAQKYTLHIKNQLKNYVTKVEVKTHSDEISRFKIFMLNDDTIEIIKR